MRTFLPVILVAVLAVAGCASAPKHEVIPVPGPLAHAEFEFDEAPDGCEPRSTASCSLDNRCPVRPTRPLKCYGPIVTQFFCCWKDPY